MTRHSPGTAVPTACRDGIDPAKDLLLVLMIQRAELPNAVRSCVRRAFQEASVRAMGK